MRVVQKIIVSNFAKIRYSGEKTSFDKSMQRCHFHVCLAIQKKNNNECYLWVKKKAAPNLEGFEFKGSKQEVSG